MMELINIFGNSNRIKKSFPTGQFKERVTLHILTIRVLAILTLLVTSSTHAQFVRFVEGEQQWQGKLQTSINRYMAKNGNEVELVAAVHECTKCRLKSNHEIAGVSPAPLPPLPAAPSPLPVAVPYHSSPLRDREATRSSRFLGPRAFHDQRETQRPKFSRIDLAKNIKFEHSEN